MIRLLVFQMSVVRPYLAWTGPVDRDRQFVSAAGEENQVRMPQTARLTLVTGQKPTVTRFHKSSR